MYIKSKARSPIHRADYRHWLKGIAVLTLLAVSLFAGDYIETAIAQSETSGQVYLPLLSSNADDSQSVVTPVPEPNQPSRIIQYDLDAPTDTQVRDVTESALRADLQVDQEPGRLELYYESEGQHKTVLQLACTGPTCASAGKTNGKPKDTSAAGSESTENLRITIYVNGVRKALVEQISRRLVRVTLWQGDQAEAIDVRSSDFDIMIDVPSEPIPPTEQPTEQPTATPTDRPAGAGTPAIEAFVLVDAVSDQDIRILQDGETIVLAVNPNITIRVQTNPATVGSVQFTLDGNNAYPDGALRRENTAPYSLSGDSNGDFNPWDPSLGSHTITAIAYSEPDGGGTAGPERTITLAIQQSSQSTPTATATPIPGASPTPSPTPTTDPAAAAPPLVFVSRQIPPNGSIYWSVPKDMPGVGPHSRFRVAAPGKLLVRESDGRIRVLIDGSQPSAATLNLIDVNAPDVSYDGKTIVFSGLPLGNYNTGPVTNLGAWRIYAIEADGSNLRQITRSDQNLNLSQFGSARGQLEDYDDTDPAWLPDGRIVFSSTRWPSFAQYSGVRTSNLHVVNADGSGLHRITSERNGADRPTVDPITGKIVYARWWRNHRFAIDSMATITDPNGGYVQKDGLTTNRSNHVGGGDFLWRNQWHAATINPDGTGLAQWGGPHHKLDSSHLYGGAFTPSGDFVANYFPMANMTEAGGFGGLRLYKRGPGTYQPLLGITYLTLDYVSPSNPTSYGIFKGSYATEPAVLADGRLVFSWAADINQDYGLYIANANGTGRILLYDNPGTTELRAKALQARPLPPIVPDAIVQTPSLLPPTASGPYDQDGTFVFDALNVYFNGPVDSVDVSAPPVGSANRIRFFTDFQRTSPGSFPNLDWPILFGERTIAPDGSVREPSAPANVPLFEQLRSSDDLVPRSSGFPDGAAHVAGMNFGRPGEVQRCVGCHAGHTMIEVPATDEAAKWTNLAPGAQVRVSSSRDANQNRGLVDRRVMNGEIWRYWTSTPGQTQNQWIELVFPVPVTVRTVRLYNPRSGGEANSSVQVNGATVRLYSDANATQQVASQSVGQLAVSGTAVAFADVRASVVRVEIGSVSGTFYGSQVASLAEVEIIARGEAGP